MYRQEFRNFFDVDPISLCGHVSKAANSFLFGSIIRHRSQFSTIAGKNATMSATRVVVMEGSYGTGYGSLVYNAVYEGSISVACGTKPVVIGMGLSHNRCPIVTSAAATCASIIMSSD